MSDEDLKLIYDVPRETPRASLPLTPYPDCSLVASLHFSISPFQPTALFTSVSFLPPPRLPPSPLAHSLPLAAASFLPSFVLPFFLPSPSFLHAEHLLPSLTISLSGIVLTFTSVTLRLMNTAASASPPSAPLADSQHAAATGMTDQPLAEKSGRSVL
ncbi:hypothetical protein E2C01_061730 [Portunus trituberculatus]|uniref:Uncharacterized protein n=1 Tax=Portunus trituberculatus TaxID=210409 RepID=A0A5B7HBS5_PORTR|nr:hypothetical protein [Portunus trituberculatus]